MVACNTSNQKGDHMSPTSDTHRLHEYFSSRQIYDMSEYGLDLQKMEAFIQAMYKHPAGRRAGLQANTGNANVDKAIQT
eukprot:4819131-Pyramimonas_sp.AAC.1